MPTFSAALRRPRFCPPAAAVAVAAFCLHSAVGAFAQSSSSPARPAPSFETPGAPYPEAARPARLTGTVTLRVTYPKEGLPLSVEIVNSSGSPLLDNTAADFARGHWRSHGLPAVSTFETPVEFRFQSDPTAPVPFDVFPENAPADARKELLFWRAVPTITSLLLDGKSDDASGRAREAMRVYAKLDPRDFSAPLSLLRAVLSNFEPAASTGAVNIVVDPAGSENPQVLTVLVSPEQLARIAPLVQRAVAAGLAEERAALAYARPAPAEKADLEAALTQLETRAAALAAGSPQKP